MSMNPVSTWPDLDAVVPPAITERLERYARQRDAELAAADRKIAVLERQLAKATGDRDARRQYWTDFDANYTACW